MTPIVTYRRLRLVLVVAAVLGALAAVLDILFPVDLQRARHLSVLVVDERDRLLRGFTTADDTWRLALHPHDVDPLYLTMLKAYEDRRFDYHPGVDPLAMVRAIGQWLYHGRIISGGSTLTMQTARLLHPRPRTVTGKLIEMLRALQLEWHYDKDEILALYLTLAPYGGNLEGLRAASLAWLGKEPRHLTAAEAALLVVLPQAPSRLRPDRYPERARTARDKVLARMVTLNVLSTVQAGESAQEAIPKRRRPMPFHAPHLARRLRLARPGVHLHRTFIDGDLQKTLETLASSQPLDPRASLAILVVENATRKVTAYLGSMDFFATPRAGQVDMVQAVRSPGSTLKPLVYGMGFEDLIIHPQTLIDDVPTRFGDYNPSNFRNTYRGQVSVEQALRRSLNVPAVAVLEQVGPRRVAARLRRAGIPLHWSGPHYQPGLPLVLGGVGASLEDLVTLYAAIAGGGELIPLRLQENDPPVPGRQLLSPAASWYLTEILQGVPPPQAVVASAHTRRPRPIAYKTGTSYGFRDAWAVGYDAGHTVGVWIGRPDGSPSPGRYGRITAAPLLFRVFDLLPESGQRPQPPPPEVILAGHDALPEHLQYLRTRPAPLRTDAAVLSIRFPVHGSRVELADRNGRLEALPLVAGGGHRPLRWLVNGAPLDASRWRRKAFWTPDGEGMVRITVIDALGQVASAEVWLEKSNHGY